MMINVKRRASEHRRSVISLGAVAVALVSCAVAPPQDGAVEERRAALTALTPDNRDVLTQHNDNSRTGSTRFETILNTDNVRGGLGQIGTLSVDGEVYAQVLYKHQVSTKSTASGTTSTRNVAYVATTKNNVYAFDADTLEQLWMRNLGTPFDHTVNNDSVVRVPFGILSTPVIDPSEASMYVVARTAPGPGYTLFKLSVADGVTLKSVSISGSYSPTGGVTRIFAAGMQWNRPALTIAGGNVYVAFGGIDFDAQPSFGWVFGYAKTDLSARGAYATTAAASATNGGGIWMSGNGLAADGANNLYFATGNALGSIDNTSSQGQADSFVKLTPTLGTPFFNQPVWARPGNHVNRDIVDVDLGSGGVMLIPGTNKLLGGGKSGLFYALETGGMTFTLPARTLDPNLVGAPYSAAAPNGATKNSFVAGVNTYHVATAGWNPLSPPADRPKCNTTGANCNTIINNKTVDWSNRCVATEEQYDSCMMYGPNIHGSPAAWVGPDGKTNIYLWTEKDYLRRLRYDDTSTTSLAALEHSPIRQTKDLMPSGVLSVSANGSTAGTGVVWATSTEVSPYVCSADITLCFASHHDVKGHLWAFDAEDVSKLLFHANVDTHAKFNPPTIANGHVFVPTFSGKVLVFGLMGWDIRPDPRVKVYRWMDSHTMEWTSFAEDERLDATQSTDAMLQSWGYVNKTFQFYGRRTGDGPTTPVARWRLARSGFRSTNEWISIGDNETSDDALLDAGYADKFFQFYARKVSDPSTVPVHRWNYPPSGGWITVADGEVKDADMIAAGYTSKTLQFHAANSHPSVVAVYRWHRISNGEWTARTADEVTDAQMQAAGFDRKTFQFFAKRGSETGTVAVNRWLYPPTGDWITISATELTDAQMTAMGYASKTLQFYAFTTTFATGVAVNRWMSPAMGWISLADGEISDAQMLAWNYSHKMPQFFGMK